MGAGGIYGIESEYGFVFASWHAGELEDVVVLGDFDSGCGRVGGSCGSVDGADEVRCMNISSIIDYEFFSHYEDLFDMLKTDIEFCSQLCTDNTDLQAPRRLLVKSFFSCVDALSSYYKNEAYKFDGYCKSLRLSAEMPSVIKCLFSEKLTAAEQYAARDLQPAIDKNGKAIEKSIYPKFLDNFKFSFSVFYKAFCLSGELNLGNCVGYNAFKRSKGIRDRLTHPKKLVDLNVSEEELNSLVEAMSWYFYEIESMHKMLGQKIKDMHLAFDSV